MEENMKEPYPEMTQEDLDYFLKSGISIEELIGGPDINPKPSYETICTEKEKLGFLIRITSGDHGIMDKKNVRSKGSHPAHAHITKLHSEVPFAHLNITGPCPKGGNDINQHYESNDKNNKDKPMNSKIKTAIAKWSNKKAEDKHANNKLNTNWVRMQNMWLATNKYTNPGNQKQK
jgi:hypothetical protein